MSGRTAQYVLLPARGMRAMTSHAARFLADATSSHRARKTKTAGIPMRVVDSIHEDGAKLVELSDDAALALRAEQPGLKLVPIVYFRPALAPRMTVSARHRSAKAARSHLAVQIVSVADRTPIAGATVVAFTDYDEGLGDQGITNAQGVVRLDLGRAKRIERLYVYPELGFWASLRRNLRTTPGRVVALDPIDLRAPDLLAHHYGRSRPRAGRGARVAVIDTGAGPHPDLAIEGGENTVVGEEVGDFGDNGHGHGTHVAGIIAARGRGLAPGVALRSYRVFGRGKGSATNYSIAKAIDRAVADGCDLINLSLGGADADDATRAAVNDARARGSLVIAAAGNEERSAVGYPAAYPMALAVSAAGRKGTFPKNSTAAGDVARPYGTDRDDFLASFSNVGLEMDLTGPGVAIVSTVPGGYAVMSGTSMACPAVTGFAARLLAARKRILKMPRDQARSDAMAQALLAAARPLGFGPRYEGHGLPR